MSQDESCQDRQSSEFEVLKAIFGDELQDLRKSRNKRKWQPLDVVITLTPQQGMSGPAEVHAQVDLHITCGDKYPQDIPKIQLKNSKGVSHQQLAVHLTELENLAKQLKGEVMIYELCQHVQKFLHEYNKPGYSSFYEEMMLKKQERIQVELQAKQLKEDKERQVLQDEILKRQEALKAEIRNRKESTRLSLESDQLLSQSIPSSPLERVRTYSRRRCMSTSESSDSPLCEHRGVKLVHFDNNKGERQVHRGKCLGHSFKGSVVYAGVDMTTGELLAISEWTLKYGLIKEHENDETSKLQHSMKQIASIEQELNHLYKLHHPNLVHYLNMKYFQDKEDNIIIYTLQEFVVGTTCSFLLTESIPVDIDLLRYLAMGILTALQYLHENNVVHKDLRDSSVHIDRTGVVKLSDYSLDKRLSDIYQSSCSAKFEHDFPTIQGRGGKKADIHRFGVLLLSLLKGCICTEKEAEIDASLQPELRDFLEKCLDNNERSRWSADQLLEHYFIKTPIDRGLPPPNQDGNQEQQLDEPEQEPDVDAHLYLPAFGGQSRIRNEFEVLKWLGEGAFGDVLKVKNKLDGGIYAIKRIKLNPKEKVMNKKITREVKLLRRLNHENVVRYYNSWIESIATDDSTVHGKLTPSETPSEQFTSEAFTSKASSDELDNPNVEKLAPPVRDVDWNLGSYESRSAAMSADSEEDNSDHSSDEDSSYEDWAFISMRTKNESSDSIIFAGDETSEMTESAKNSQNLVVDKNETDSVDAEVNFLQCMYIQMEFCEKSTLRTAIDGGLYKDEERIWRLFREIVEGLAHIHQQGMIHRDLKPVNIFLDSNDNVKIGDFGLATTNILSLTQAAEVEKELQANEKFLDSELENLGSMTGQVGTALYAAPELSEKAVKAIYNQKVDIYSLGIIFFEMCYKPLTTGMERVKILLSLRTKDIVFPADFLERGMTPKVHLLKWLLDHDPSQRPTSQELLSSEYLPPPQLEEAELQEMIRHTLSNAQSKAYKYLIACCMKQEVTAAEDVTYDIAYPGRGPSISSQNIKSNLFSESIKSKVLEIFQRHGGVNITTPLLMPKSGPLYNQTENCVCLMTRAGSVVSIPHDLRAPFARYVVRNNITNMRRYAIERVYREKKVHGFHPRELYECAFDIVSPVANNLRAEAELLFIAWEICNEISNLKDRKFAISINHISLLKAVLMYCGIEEEKHHDIYSILSDSRDGKSSRFQLQTHLISLCLTDQAMETLYNLLETESSVARITSVLKTITKRKGDAASLAKEGLKDIEAVIAAAEAYGVKWPISVAPLLIHNVQQHSGVIFQITYEVKRKKKRGTREVIAAGGRYDKVLASFRRVLERTGMASKEAKQFGAGISISLEQLICAASECTEDLYQEPNKFAIDVAVGCVDGEPRREKELIEVSRELWSLGLKVTCPDLNTSEELLEYCRENGINQVVLLKSGDRGHLRIESWERDRFQERKISLHDLAEQFQKPSESNTSIALNRSDSKVSANEITSSSNTACGTNINFVLNDREKLSGSGRRSYKNVMLAQMSSFLQRMSNKVPIEVFGVFLEATVVRMIVAFLDVDEDEQDFQKSVQLIIDRHPRHKKYIKQICDEMWEARNDKSHPALILYSLYENKYKALL